MPPPTNPTDLEALVWAQTTKINSLSNLNQVLTAQLSCQSDLLEKYKADLFTSSTSPYTTPALYPRQPSPVPRPPHTTQPPPRPTPFYLDSRSAKQVQLSFVIPGFQGESLPMKMNLVDLAFVLERTLERRGWRAEMTRKGVDDFLERPMVEVRWLGRLD